MNQTVKAFLDAEQEKVRRRRQETLTELGLFEKEYAPNNVSSEDYPFWDWDANGSPVYYRKIPVEVTEEEYQQIMKYVRTDNGSGTNGVAKALDITAWIIFIGGFLLGLIMAVETSGYDTEFSFAVALACWGTAFLSGLLLLGLSEIIKLLDAIKRKP